MTALLPRLLVIGGSAGSLDVLLQLLPQLDSNWALAMIIVLHRKNDNDGLLPGLLAPRTTLSVKEAEEKDVIAGGTIYIAPCDYHLLLEPDGSITLDASEKINFSRPSIDVTFSAAAEVMGSRLACLLLSGANLDGSEGLQQAFQMGAVVAVQDPATAEVAFMPRHALSVTPEARVLQIKDMIGWVNAL